MIQLLLIFFFSIVVATVVSNKFGIPIFLFAGFFYIQFFPKVEILDVLYLLSVSAVSINLAQNLHKKHLKKEFGHLLLLYLTGLLFNKIFIDENIAINIYKYRINFIVKFTDLICLVLLVWAINSKKDLIKPLLFFLGFTYLSGLYLLIYSRHTSKFRKDESSNLAQLLIALSLLLDLIVKPRLSMPFSTPNQLLLLIGSLAILSTAYLSMIVKIKLASQIYGTLEILLLVFLSIALIFSNLAPF